VTEATLPGADPTVAAATIPGVRGQAVLARGPDADGPAAYQGMLAGLKANVRPSACRRRKVDGAAAVCALQTGVCTAKKIVNVSSRK
jgi:hypothetical protein